MNKLYMKSGVQNDNHMYLHTHVHVKQVITPVCWMQLHIRLAIRIRYLPDFPFQWSDTNPQRSRQSLTIDDFLPSSEDAMKLQQSAVQYLKSFLVENFTDLADLQC